MERPDLVDAVARAIHARRWTKDDRVPPAFDCPSDVRYASELAHAALDVIDAATPHTDENTRLREALTQARQALLRREISDAGERSLTDLGIGHYHDDEWEWTQPARDLDYALESLRESGEPVLSFSTLIDGPLLWAANVPMPDDAAELRFFSSEAAAIASLKGN